MLNKDILGMICSGLCVMHCLAIPILFALGITGISIGFLQDEWTHWLFVIPIIILLATSLPSGFSVHADRKPIILGITGLVLLLSGLTIFEAYEKWLIVAASVLIITAHYSNRKLMNIENKLRRV